AIQAADPAGQTTLSTHVLAFRQELALVEVVTRDTGVSQIYRQQRAYRRTEEGWQEVEAVGAVRGAWQTLETSYFTLSYQSGDAEAVYQAVPTLDHLYEQMRRDLALPAPEFILPTEQAAGPPLLVVNPVVAFPAKPTGEFDGVSV